MFSLFESRARRTKDASEILQIFKTHGENAVEILQKRGSDFSLSKRDRKHWKRLARKASAQRHIFLDKTSS